MKRLHLSANVRLMIESVILISIIMLFFQLGAKANTIDANSKKLENLEAQYKQNVDKYNETLMSINTRLATIEGYLKNKGE
jgi:alanine dehydrogenase